jgi:uncharacterized alkaline shock family protein YloU
MALSANPGPNPEPAEGREVLPCGRTLQQVWDAWDEDRVMGDPHYAACPHCTTALHGLRMLDDFVRSARTEDETQRRVDGHAAGDRDTEGVTARVMDIVRRELRPGRSLPLADPDGPDPPEAAAEDAWIVEAAAARAFRSALERLPGVRAGSCRIVPEQDRPGVHVRVQVAADLSRSIPALADEVRGRIRVAARDAVGLLVTSVDVAVVDVLPGTPDGEGER